MKKARLIRIWSIRLILNLFRRRLIEGVVLEDRVQPFFMRKGDDGTEGTLE